MTGWEEWFICVSVGIRVWGVGRLVNRQNTKLTTNRLTTNGLTTNGLTTTRLPKQKAPVPVKGRTPGVRGATLVRRFNQKSRR